MYKLAVSIQLQLKVNTPTLLTTWIKVMRTTPKTLVSATKVFEYEAQVVCVTQPVDTMVTWVRLREAHARSDQKIMSMQLSVCFRGR